jgi:hypothetical protein
VTAVPAGVQQVITFKVSGKARNATRAALRHGGRAKAMLRVSVTDAAGNMRVIAFRVVVR